MKVIIENDGIQIEVTDFNAVLKDKGKVDPFDILMLFEEETLENINSFFMILDDLEKTLTSQGNKKENNEKKISELKNLITNKFTENMVEELMKYSKFLKEIKEPPTRDNKTTH